MKFQTLAAAIQEKILKPFRSVQLNTCSLKAVLSFTNYLICPSFIRCLSFLFMYKTWTNGCRIKWVLYEKSTSEDWIYNCLFSGCYQNFFFLLNLVLPSSVQRTNRRKGNTPPLAQLSLHTATENAKVPVAQHPPALTGTLSPLVCEVNLVRLNDTIFLTAFSHLQLEPCQGSQVGRGTLSLPCFHTCYNRDCITLLPSPNYQAVKRTPIKWLAIIAWQLFRKLPI